MAELTNMKQLMDQYRAKQIAENQQKEDMNRAIAQKLSKEQKQRAIMKPIAGMADILSQGAGRQPTQYASQYPSIAEEDEKALLIEQLKKPVENESDLKQRIDLAMFGKQQALKERALDLKERQTDIKEEDKDEDRKLKQDKLEYKRHRDSIVRKINELDPKKHYDLMDEFNKDIKEEKKMYSGINTVKELLKSNNPVMRPAIARQLLKTLGDYRFSDADVKQFGGSDAFVDQVKQYTQKLTKGNFTEENREYYMELVDAMEKAIIKDSKRKAHTYVDLSNLLGVTQENAKKILDSRLSALYGGKADDIKLEGYDSIGREEPEEEVVEDGYRWLGGDKKDPENWEKI